MYQYYIFSMTKNENGEYEHDVKWTFDETDKAAYHKAESLYYDILSKAAIAEGIVFKSVVMMNAEGRIYATTCINHAD